VRRAAEVIMNDMYQDERELLSRSKYDDLVEQAIAANVSSPIKTHVFRPIAAQDTLASILAVTQPDRSYIDEAKMMER
jgi:hypothetical protein